MENLRVWVTDNNVPLLGNALSCAIALAFAYASKAKDSEVTKSADFEEIRRWWEVFWLGLLVMYLGWAILSLVSSTSIAIYPWSIFHGVATSAVTMLWLLFNSEKAKRTKNRLRVIFGLVFVLAASSSYLDFRLNGEEQDLFLLLSNGNVVIKAVSHLIPFLPFVLLAWSYHRKHMATALIFLSYAYLQLPPGILGKPGLDVDFITLIVNKVFLIGAMFHTLGVRDAESKPS